MLSQAVNPATPSATSQSTFNLWRIAWWCGLLSGFGELAGLGVQKFVLHQMTYFGWHILWMAPLANACVFVLLGAIYQGISVFWPRLRISVKMSGDFAPR